MTDMKEQEYDRLCKREQELLNMVRKQRRNMESQYAKWQAKRLGPKNLQNKVLKLVCNQMEELHSYIMGVDYEQPEDEENDEGNEPSVIISASK